MLGYWGTTTQCTSDGKEEDLHPLGLMNRKNWPAVALRGQPLATDHTASEEHIRDTGSGR